MASAATAILNLLAGGVQGFADAQDRARNRRSALAEKGKEQDIQETEFEEERSDKSAQATRQNDLEQKRIDEETKRRVAEQTAHTEDLTATKDYQTKELALRGQEVANKKTIDELQLKITKMQEGESKWDPYKVIAQGVAEVYTKNATGDNPGGASAIAAKAASDLHTIFGTLGLIDGYAGAPAGAGPAPAEGTQYAYPQPPGGSYNPNAGGPDEGGIGFQFPAGNNPFLYLGSGQLGIGRTRATRAKAIADSLRTLGNAKR